MAGVMHGSAHLWTAFAYYIIGLALLGMAFTVWWTHPVNRVFIFGRYLTPEGLRVVMMSWPMVALFGAFIFSCAVDHMIDWANTNGYPQHHSTIQFFSVVEAVISWVTALVVMYLGGRTLLRALCRK